MSANRSRRPSTIGYELAARAACSIVSTTLLILAAWAVSEALSVSSSLTTLSAAEVTGSGATVGPAADASNAAAQPQTATPTEVAVLLPTFKLADARGKAYTDGDFRDASVLVVAFLGVECPLAKIYGGRLQEVAQKYQSKGVRLLGVNANAQDSVTELLAYAQRHQLTFPLLKDVGNRLADELHAERTPEVFVFDRAHQLRYRGRIDDQYGIGYVRDQPQQQDLIQAIDELLAGRPVSQSKTVAPGCLIGRVREPDAQAEITYHNTIKDLLQRRCVECHRAGDIGPFALSDYDEVVGWAEMIAEVVAERRMPPWHATDNGVALAEDRRLSDEERNQIADWVAAGAPRGSETTAGKDVASATEAKDDPAARVWQLSRAPDLVVPIQERPFTVPAEGAVRYQYFSAPTHLTEDKWIEAVEVRPGNRAVVHHVLVFALPAGEIKADFGGGVRGFLASYVPGLRAEPYPVGMAKRLPAGSQLVFQLHYTPVGSEQEDLSEIAFLFTDPEHVQYEVTTVSAFQPNLQIPPGVNDHAEMTKTQLNQPVKLLGLMPHLHLRGKSFQYLLRRSAGDDWTSLLDIPAYDFNWQTNYRLAEPLDLPAGAIIKCVAQFDNSEANLSNPNARTTVRWGEQTWEEMLIGYFDVAVPRQSETPSILPSRANEFILQLDADDDLKLQMTELPWRMRLAAVTADQDRDGSITEDELVEWFKSRRPREKKNKADNAN